ncbi:MAG: UDP-N-acetylmuramoyl-L-alanine--D-glutamate ligase [Candidatus Omnitrophica bacterium]|nr:UDP-N-acetylmuramoyl-L-alanine--D-glutamate ligase [Candidatus Omnitrophota bacterium]MBU4302899.1 UDP-N-acetylmuramoyl-L-alanine--D-glutamate ligase [Candidatus Omnitrophota bacterium]MBU4418830.1 UDP-N-acetylmuramoyl-L-alanine--D-glutamate ligase [Candidatus Omnitrophota bacterium]MBU4468147.1 UDP-N-acetylmuramoyl-L-alanine--D-glutamate ligase [Candidatus Omnitrophota bacterium]
MPNYTYFKNKKVTIIGLARSGVACANLLHQSGAIVSVTEIKDDPQSRQASAKLVSSEIKVELGKHSRSLIEQADLVVISPGVPLDSLCVNWVKEYNKLLISEIEVASILCPAQIIAITGSNGKTTVTTLIGKVLEAAQKKVFVCGNIGNPFCDEVKKLRESDFVVLEVSSFQLETIKDFKPKIAVILNLTPNHLDRYNNLQEYLDAKKRIFMNQDQNDFLVLNGDDPLLSAAASGAKSEVVFFTKEEGLNPNQSAVMAVGRILGVELKQIQKVFQEFKGIEHRLEEVAEINGVKFINDSKATTADSAIWAINNISSPIILIAGGRHKGIDYRVILDAAKGKVKQAFLIGEAKDIIAADLNGGDFSIEKADTLKQAVTKAHAQASPGDCVLLSPMCSSYDMFTDYEERGRAFREIVLDLAGEAKARG